MPDDRVVDLANRVTRAWLPRVDDFGKPTEARLYVELVRAAGLRLSLGLDGAPRVTVADEKSLSGARVMKVPSPELTAYLDSFRVRRGQPILDEEVADRFVRLVRARCASPDFVPDHQKSESTERAVLPVHEPSRGAPSEYEDVRELVRRLADPSTVEQLIHHRARLTAETGFRVMTIPAGVRGRVFVLDQLNPSRDGAESSWESGMRRTEEPAPRRARARRTGRKERRR